MRLLTIERYALWARFDVALHTQDGPVLCTEVAENAGKLIVVVLPDTGERYLSTLLFQRE